MVEIKIFIVGLLETNCYLVYNRVNKNGFLIDPGFFDKRILDTIKGESIKVKNIINTHGHSDHTAANKKFGYPTLIHEDDIDFLKNPTKYLSFPFHITSSSAYVDIARLLKDRDIIAEDGITFEVIHTPGHTPGSICLKMGNRIFTGDTLFREGIGRTDLTYGNETNLLRAIRERLMVFPNETEILPGHGPSSTIGYERENNPFLIRT
ncbi:MAG: hypothetical protein A2Y81_08725 [Nitrospirae bacterium RBG_13_43_8]|nr:MAG: hypothetical protein A2Y81_08725 [Nitrospirae bacterium RBG_13_43_8]